MTLQSLCWKTVRHKRHYQCHLVTNITKYFLLITQVVLMGDPKVKKRNILGSVFRLELGNGTIGAVWFATGVGNLIEIVRVLPQTFFIILYFDLLFRTHIYPHAHTHTHTCTHTRVHIRTQAHTHTRVYIYTHIYTCTHTHAN